jgi:hypothetical protein
MGPTLQLPPAASLIGKSSPVHAARRRFHTPFIIVTWRLFFIFVILHSRFFAPLILSA